MKTKKIVRKLILKKVTVTNLDAGRMHALKGGLERSTFDATCGDTCNYSCGYTCGMETCETCPTCMGDTCEYPCLPC